MRVAVPPQRSLFGGVECEKQRVELHHDTNTPLACAPKVRIEGRTRLFCAFNLLSLFCTFASICTYVLRCADPTGVVVLWSGDLRIQPGEFSLRIMLWTLKKWCMVLEEQRLFISGLFCSCYCTFFVTDIKARDILKLEKKWYAFFHYKLCWLHASNLQFVLTDIRNWWQSECSTKTNLKKLLNDFVKLCLIWRNAWLHSWSLQYVASMLQRYIQYIHHLSIQESCLRNIKEDLRHYYRVLTRYFHPERSPYTSLLLSLKELMEVTKATPTLLGSPVKLQHSFVCHFMGSNCFSYAYVFFCFLTELLYVVRGRGLAFREGKLLNWFEVVYYTCACFFCKSLSSCSPLQAAPEPLRSYGDRLRFCKVLSGFRVRTITINRAIAYMSSGEHMQWLWTKIFIAMRFSITMMRETVFIYNRQFMTDAWYKQTIYLLFINLYLDSFFKEHKIKTFAALKKKNIVYSSTFLQFIFTNWTS